MIRLNILLLDKCYKISSIFVILIFEGQETCYKIDESRILKGY